MTCYFGPQHRPTCPCSAPRTPPEVDWKDTGRVICIDCGWRGVGYELLAQACPICDGRCADVKDEPRTRLTP